MPFTPLHLGPVFVFGLFLRRWLHLPTLIVASIAVDVEPLLVIVLKLDYPLHGYLHTFLFAIPYGIAVGYAMIYLEKPFNSLYKALLLEEAKPIDKKPFLLAGLIGTISHILLDSPLYGDIHPFYPLKANPLYNPSLTQPIYYLCMWTLLIGALIYLSLWIVKAVKR
jgi:membrane-bound metal-dependent hydrolase YbcI (DUF457 family)